MLAGIPPNPNVSLLLIGNELLSGKIRDENGYFTTKLFYQHGISLKQILVISDEPETIQQHVNQQRQAYDVLITSGGVGPTHDDCTMESIAQALGKPLVVHDEFLAGLKAGYRDRFNDQVARMALLPKGAELISDNQLSWPIIQIQNIFVLPGVPQIYRKKLSVLASQIAGQPMILKQLYIGEDEAQISAMLSQTDAHFPQVAIGSYPVFNTSAYKVKLTFESKVEDQVDAAVKYFMSLVPASYIVEPPRS